MRLQEYLAEINKIRLLDPEEESQLWTGFKDLQRISCRQLLIEHYQPLVYKAVSRWRIDSERVMDLIQEGTIGLIEAVENFDHTRGVAFSLYAIHRIRGRMLNHLEKEGRVGILSVDALVLAEDGQAAFSDTLIDQGIGVQETVERNFVMAQLKKALTRLSPKEQTVLNGVYVYGLDTGQLAAELNVSTSHIYRLQKHGIRRVRGMMSRLINELKK